MKKQVLSTALGLLTAIYFSTDAVYPQRAPKPGDGLGETLCAFQCNWEGYEFRVHRPGGMAGTTARILELVKIDQVFFARPRFIQAHFGTTIPDPEVARVELYKESATIDDGICDRFGNPITGKVYRVFKRNTLNFESGQTPILHDVGMCDRGLGGVADLRHRYNSTIKPAIPIPRCSAQSQGCRPVPPPPPDREGTIGPLGHTPAEFESPSDRPTGIVERRWTGWLNRDTPGGKGDYESLSAFRESGDVCPTPVDIQCQTVGGVDSRESGEVYTCEAAKGGICVNSDQNDGRCLNYRVRFLCEK